MIAVVVGQNVPLLPLVLYEKTDIEKIVELFWESNGFNIQTTTTVKNMKFSSHCTFYPYIYRYFRKKNIAEIVFWCF